MPAERRPGARERARGRGSGGRLSAAGRVQSMRGLGLVDLRGVGDAALGLRLGRERVEPGERIDDQPRAHVPTAGRAGRRSCRPRPMGVACAQEHRAGVEPRLHLHDADAGLGVARQDRAVDRRGPAPARQERGVDVEAAVARRVEHRLRQDQAIGDDHARCRRRAPRSRPAPRACAGSRGGAPAGPAPRPGLDGRRAVLLAATGGARRLGVDADDLVARRRPARRARGPRSRACP